MFWFFTYIRLPLLNLLIEMSVLKHKQCHCDEIYDLGKCAFHSQVVNAWLPSRDHEFTS